MKKLFLTTLLIFVLSGQIELAQQKIGLRKISIGVDNAQGGDVSATLQLLLLLTVLSLAPSILIMTTSYLRIIIVFHFLKNALGTQQMPPSQLLAGIALFITFFIMAPTWNKVNDTAIKPLMEEQITFEQAYDTAIVPIRVFMFKHVRAEDLELFISMTTLEKPKTREDLPIYILVPAFALSELRTGFIIGFFLYIPFIMLDMIIGSILLSMGMMMIPPMMISLPFKILLFILVDGWNLIVNTVIKGFM
jgi:flagellar biosynthetic protein FliP